MIKIRIVRTIAIMRQKVMSVLVPSTYFSIKTALAVAQNMPAKCGVHVRRYANKLENDTNVSVVTVTPCSTINSHAAVTIPIRHT